MQEVYYYLKSLIRLDLSDLEPTQILGPFLEIIKCGDTTGPITGTALSSIQLFIQKNLIGILFFFITFLFRCKSSKFTQGHDQCCQFGYSL